MFVGIEIVIFIGMNVCGLVQEPGPSQSLDETAMNTSTAFHSPSHPGFVYYSVGAC